MTMRTVAIGFCALSIIAQAAVVFLTGRFDLAAVAMIGACFAYVAWALWDDLD